MSRAQVFEEKNQTNKQNRENRVIWLAEERVLGSLPRKNKQKYRGRKGGKEEGGGRITR